MASDKRPQFKHPIVRADKTPEELVWITPEELLSAAEPDTGLTQTVWHGLNVIIRKMISMEEAQNLVRVILRQCWNGEEYCVEMVDFQLRCAVITFYTNVTLPEEAEMQYAILYGTDLYDTVRDRINEGQMAAIEGAVGIYLN